MVHFETKILDIGKENSKRYFFCYTLLAGVHRVDLGVKFIEGGA